MQDASVWVKIQGFLGVVYIIYIQRPKNVIYNLHISLTKLIFGLFYYFVQKIIVHYFDPFNQLKMSLFLLFLIFYAAPKKYLL
jgi:hypothetical protein